MAWWAAGPAPTGPGLPGLIALSATAMGVQSVAARRLAVSGVSTTYVTGTLTGLVAEVAALMVGPAGRRRQAAVLGALLAGAVIGGLLETRFHQEAGIVPAAVVAAVTVTAAAGFRRLAERGAGSTASPA